MKIINNLFRVGLGGFLVLLFQRPILVSDKMVLQCKNWIFTLNNYTNDDTVRLRALDGNETIEYLIFGREVGENGTPHFQGFVRFSTKKRLRGVQSLIGRNCHFEVSKSPTKAITYCKKDGDFEEFGEYVSNQGKRTDREELELVKQEIVEGNFDIDYYIEHYTHTWARYEKILLRYIEMNRKVKRLDAKPLRVWQAKLWRYLDGPPSDRKVKFIIDPQGNTGKSWFARYYEENSHKKVQLLTSSKHENLAYAYKVDTNVLFMDVPRSKYEYLSFDFLESVKNGCLFSGKYASCTKRFDTPHVVVFMNQMPPMDKLSTDRYDVEVITNSDCVCASDNDIN
jgi:hypothetical protein